MKTPHLLTLEDITAEELHALLAIAVKLKACRGKDVQRPLSGKTLALIFSKSSTRTRVSFEAGIHELGGNSLFMDPHDLQLGRGESIADTARVLSRYVHGVVIRTHKHEELEEYARFSTIPVINALTDRSHPCQLLADLLTIYEYFGRLDGIRVTYLGDGANNMALTWIVATQLAGMKLTIAAPFGYQPDPAFITSIPGCGTIIVTDDPVAAVAAADVLYTDVWVSMGYEEESKERLQILAPYQINQSLLNHAGASVKIMHCLPAKRGQEITSEALDSTASIVWDQAENRLHAQKALMTELIR
jgi:ornithine carbamoyltransferase